MLGVKAGQASLEVAMKVALLIPFKFKAALNQSSQPSSKCKIHTAVWDTGASICVSPDRDDFINYSTTTDLNSVRGLSGGSTNIAGQGEVLWSILDVNGMLRHFKLKAYHVPSSKVRLISTTSLLQAYKGELSN